MLQDIASQATNLLAQVTMPDNDTDMWPWVAGTAVGLLVVVCGVVGTLFWHVVGMYKDENTRLREDKKTCESELGKTTESLRGMNDVAERQRLTVAEDTAVLAKQMQEGFAQIAKLSLELLDVIAPRRRNDV